MSSAVEKLWDISPDWVKNSAGLIKARRAGETAPSLPMPEPRDVRLMIGPANFAGQARRWAAAVSGNPQISALNMVTGTENPFGFEADYVVPHRISAHSGAWQRSFLDYLASNYSHVLIEAERRLLGGAFGGDVLAQIAELRRRGLTIGMVAHGTDIRLPSRHVSQVKWSPFADWPEVAEVEAGVEHNAAILRQAAANGASLFVTTPGLLVDVPTAQVLPLAIDPQLWSDAAPQPPLTKRKLTVVHIPSSGRIKGTQAITPILEKLGSEDLIDYTPITGIAHGEMPAAYGEADIVLDQFLLGDYGVAACEAMAAGRLVLGHVTDQVRAEAAKLAGMKLPIVEATVDSLESVLREVIANPGKFRVEAIQGSRFVAALHNGVAARSVLEEWLLA